MEVAVSIQSKSRQQEQNNGGGSALPQLSMAQSLEFPGMLTYSPLAAVGCCVAWLTVRPCRRCRCCCCCCL